MVCPAQVTGNRSPCLEKLWGSCQTFGIPKRLIKSAQNTNACCHTGSPIFFHAKGDSAQEWLTETEGADSVPFGLLDTQFFLRRVTTQSYTTVAASHAQKLQIALTSYFLLRRSPSWDLGMKSSNFQSRSKDFTHTWNRDIDNPPRPSATRRATYGLLALAGSN